MQVRPLELVQLFSNVPTMVTTKGQRNWASSRAKHLKQDSLGFSFLWKLAPQAAALQPWAVVLYILYYYYFLVRFYSLRPWPNSELSFCNLDLIDLLHLPPIQQIVTVTSLVISEMPPTCRAETRGQFFSLPPSAKLPGFKK